MADISVKATYANGNLTVAVDGLTGIGEIFVNDSGSPLTFVQPPHGEVTRKLMLEGDKNTVTVFDTITTEKTTCEIGDGQPKEEPTDQTEPAVESEDGGKITITLRKQTVLDMINGLKVLHDALTSWVEE